MDIIIWVLFTVGFIFILFGLPALTKCIIRSSCCGHKGTCTHTTQLLFAIAVSCFILFFVFEALGDTAFHSMLTGLSVGIGLALQPLIRAVINGSMFSSMHIASSGYDITIDGKCGAVDTVGLFHTWIATPEGLVMVNNNYLDSKPLVLVRRMSGAGVSSAGASSAGKMRY